jgi:hypothetical protein
MTLDSIRKVSDCAARSCACTPLPPCSTRHDHWGLGGWGRYDDRIHRPLDVECRERAEEVPDSREYQLSKALKRGLHRAAWLWCGPEGVYCYGEGDVIFHVV